MRRASLLAWVVLSGCVTAGAALDDTRRDTLLFGEVPEGKWREVTAPGFTLLSDVDAVQLQEAAQLIAQAETALHVMMSAPKEPRVVHIVLYANRFEFEAKHGRGDSELLGDTLFLCVPLRDAVVLDGLSQVLITAVLPYRPHWLNVGLSADFAAMRWRSRNSLLLGAPNPAMYTAYLSSRSVNVKQLHTWFGGGDPHLAFSGLSWALIRWASSEQPQLLATYLRLVAEGDSERAWQQTFAPLASHLDADIYRFVGLGRFTSSLRFVPDTQHIPVTVRAAEPPP